jgi:cephalosporin hydroxylase
MRSPQFWDWFDNTARRRLFRRSESFAAVFEELDLRDRPVLIVETGTVRSRGNWEGDGQSTILFDKWSAWHVGTRVISIDLDAEACALAREVTTSRVEVLEGNSVEWLKDMRIGHPPIDLLYLDSGDDPALMLAEFNAAWPMLRPGSIVLADDSPRAGVPVGELWTGRTAAMAGKIEGKGRLLAERLAGAPFAVPWFSGYQAAWRITGN